MISSNLQEKIREYAESLHASQRGAFIAASQYPRWKKRLFLFLITRGQGVKSCETLEQLIEIFNLEEAESSEATTILSDLREFLLLPISIPLITLAISPFLADIFKRKLTWESTSSSKIFEAMALGVLLD
jgi:hypothetical protein